MVREALCQISALLAVQEDKDFQFISHNLTYPLQYTAIHLYMIYLFAFILTSIIFLIINNSIYSFSIYQTQHRPDIQFVPVLIHSVWLTGIVHLRCCYVLQTTVRRLTSGLWAASWLNSTHSGHFFQAVVKLMKFLKYVQCLAPHQRFAIKNVIHLQWSP